MKDIPIPERELSYGEILEKKRQLEKRRTSAGSKDFAETIEVRPSENAPSGFIRRTKLKDKRLFNHDIANQRHLRSIQYED